MFKRAVSRVTGYVKIYKPDMRFCEYETYKSVYCGLCKELGKSYSPISRLTLSYDYTLLALLYMSLSNETPTYCQKKCVVNPLKKCNFCETKGEEIKYSAAVSIALLNLKVKDNIKDSGFFKALIFRVLYLFTVRWNKKAIKQYPILKEIMNEYHSAQSVAEMDENCGVDKASHPTAFALSQIFSFCSSNRLEQENLKRFGYCLGKWIYLLDAADDLEKDKKNGNFNPLKNIENLNEFCTPLLNNCEVETAAALDSLEIKKFKIILENIVFQGLKFSKETVLNKEKK